MTQQEYIIVHGESEYPWVIKAKDGTQHAFCKVCKKNLQPRKAALKVLAESKDHKQRVSAISSMRENVFQTDRRNLQNSQSLKKTEIQLAVTIADVERSPSFLSTPDTDPGDGTLTARSRSISHINLYRSREYLMRKDPSTESDDASKTINAESGISCSFEFQHQGKEVLHTVVALPIDTVFSLFFIQEQFMIDVYAARKTTDVEAGPWEDQEDGTKIRQVTYAMAINIASFGSKTSLVTEKQVLRQSRTGEVYVVEAEAVNSNIPYADAFYVFTHYCFTREVDGRTNITVWASIKYKKTLWGFIKTVLEKNAYHGLEAVLAEAAHQLNAEGDKLSHTTGTRRRRRVATLAGDKVRGLGSARSYKHGQKQGSQSATEEKEGKGWLGLIMMSALLILTAVNVILYYKLWHLEKEAVKDSLQSNAPTIRFLGAAGSWEGVARVLQRQEHLHEKQLAIWKSKLLEASQGLQEIQESIENVLTTIPEHLENLKSALLQESDVTSSTWQEYTEAPIDDELEDLPEDAMPPSQKENELLDTTEAFAEDNDFGKS